jgi:hypothetical protein
VAPLLELVRGVRSPVEPSAELARFAPQAQPLVRATPAGDAAARMVEAVRQQPASAPGDDRVTLQDLTLISIASATQQVAASPQGSAPAPVAARPQAETHAAKRGGNQAKGASPGEIEELAHKVFEEYQRLVEIARERSGDPWES